jgi:glutamate racemase
MQPSSPNVTFAKKMTAFSTFPPVSMPGPIGVFDSGYGGLTIFREIVRVLPQYDFIYLGDNARAPYGSRSFETIYEYTLECVEHLFAMGCPLVILACNTASAKALRSIQQNDLPRIAPQRRVLGVIRPTSEIAGSFTQSGQLGVLATRGTVVSESYVIEIKKFFPSINVFQEACPMWVPLVENNEHLSPGANYFIEKHISRLLAQSSQIDAIILGCTHYPLLIPKIRQFLPDHIRLVAQGEIVAERLADYLLRHPEMDAHLGRNGSRRFLTTETPEDFNVKAGIFLDDIVTAEHLDLNNKN